MTGLTHAVTVTWPNNIGKRRKLATIRGRTIYLVVKDEIVIPSGTEKLIYFQRLEFEESKRLEYRFGYYMRGFKESRKGRWVWGQYCLMLTEVELRKLLKLARAKRWKGI